MKESHRQSDNYLERLSLSVEQGKVLVTPITASLQANKHCNSKCEYCGIWENHAINPPVEDLLLAVNELADLGVHLISLTGGEPFLHSELPRIVQHMGSRKIVSSTMTNGLLLNPSHVIPILEAGLNSLCVSLDTVEPETYRSIRGVAVNRVIEGLQYVSSIRSNFPSLVVFSINSVISKANIDQLPALVEFCSELGISVGFQPLHNSFESRYNPQALQFGEDDLPHLHKQIENLLKMKQAGYRIDNDWEYLNGFPDFLVYKRLPSRTVCTAGFTTIAIDVDLNVKSCWPKHPVGNLRSGKLSEYWYSDNYRKARTSMLKIDCPKCWLRCHTDYLSSKWLDDLMKKIAEVRSRSDVGDSKE